jgi:hypothetical protein
MQVAFKKSTTSAFGWLIKLYTRGEYCHSELVFSTGSMFSSDEEDGGSRFIDGPKDGVEYDYLDVPMSREDERRIITFCMQENKCPYDKQGIAFSFLPVPLGYQNPDAWFCSEICTAALQLAGYCTGYTPARVHPNKLYKILKEELCQRSKKESSPIAAQPLPVA